MDAARIRHALALNPAGIMLVLTLSGLTAGLALHAAGAGQAGNAAWLAAGLLVASYALWAVGEALLRRQMGVDVIALLAVGGAICLTSTTSLTGGGSDPGGHLVPKRQDEARGFPRARR